MKILVLSDSHSTNLDSISFEQYDAVIHCGDYGHEKHTLLEHGVHFVCGNCDLFGPKSSIIELFGKKIWITHGDYENVKFTYDRLIYKAMEYQVDICFFGHTHQQICIEEDQILFINPGSYPSSYVIINDNEILFYHQHNVIHKMAYRW